MKMAMWVTETCRRYMECIILSHTLMGNCWFWHHTEMYLVFSHSYKLAVIWSIHVYFSNITWVKSVREKVKVKVTPVQALRLCTGRMAHRGSRGIALLFHDHSTRRGWGVSVMPQPLFTPWKDPVPIVQEVGGPQDQCGQVRKISHPLGFDPWTIHPIASPYTNYATQPKKCKVQSFKMKVILGKRKRKMNGKLCNECQILKQ
jgi:hypothetical protein